MTAHNLVIEQRSINELEQHPDNPRNGDIDLIADSLANNGQYKPIVVTNDNVILAGNHTYQAALSLGWETLAAVTVDLPANSPQATRIMLADNRTSDMGNYDDGLLLASLSALDGELDGTGYDEDDYTDLAALLAYRDKQDTQALTDSKGSALTTSQDGQALEASFLNRTDMYAAKDTRSILLPYGVEDYAQTIELLKQAREKAGCETNSQVVVEALRSYVGE